MSVDGRTQEGCVCQLGSGPGREEKLREERWGAGRIKESKGTQEEMSYEEKKERKQVR